jgi:hypothetical protein
MSHVKIQNKFLYLLFTVIYFFLVFLYYKPSWVEDHLHYVVIATSNHLHDYELSGDIWGIHSKGNFSERFTILFPIRLLSKLIFFLSPEKISLYLTVIVNFLTLMIVIMWLQKRYNILTATICYILILFISQHMKFHFTEVLADIYATFLLILILFLYDYKEKKKSLFLLLGFLFFAILNCKLHYFFAGILIFIIELYNKRIQNLKYIILGFIIAFLTYSFFFYFSYPKSIHKEYLTLVYNTYFQYFKYTPYPKPFLYWFKEWIFLFFTWHYLPFFILSTYLILIKKNHKNITNNIIFLSSIVIFFLILTLSITKDFHTNFMYAYSLLIFLPVSYGILITENLNEKSFKQYNQYLLFKNNFSIQNISLFILLVYFATTIAGIYFSKLLIFSKTWVEVYIFFNFILLFFLFLVFFYYFFFKKNFFNKIFNIKILLISIFFMLIFLYIFFNLETIFKSYLNITIDLEFAKYVSVIFMSLISFFLFFFSLISFYKNKKKIILLLFLLPVFNFITNFYQYTVFVPWSKSYDDYYKFAAYFDVNQFKNKTILAYLDDPVYWNVENRNKYRFKNIISTQTFPLLNIEAIVNDKINKKDNRLNKFYVENQPDKVDLIITNNVSEVKSIFNNFSVYRQINTNFGPYFLLIKN